MELEARALLHGALAGVLGPETTAAVVAALAGTALEGGGGAVRALFRDETQDRDGAQSNGGGTGDADAALVGLQNSLPGIQGQSQSQSEA